jgi:hypothetical protein
MLTAHWTFASEDLSDDGVRDSAGSGLVMALEGLVDRTQGPTGWEKTANPQHPQQAQSPETSETSEKEGALAFDGLGRATIPAAPQLVLNQLFGFSIAFFVRVAEGATGEWRGLLYKPVAEHDARGLGLWLYPDALRLRVQLFTASGGPEYADSTRALPLGEWTHVAVVVDQDGLYLYLDGTLDAGVPLQHPVVTLSGATFLGRDPTGLGFRGDLADLRFYGSAISAEAVKSLTEG